MIFFIYFIYQLVLFVLLPFIIFRLLYKSIKISGYRRNIFSRFGFCNLRLKECIWIHAVSVGETVAASILINKILKKTDLPIVVTTMTPTGRDQLFRLFKNNNKIFHSYIPYLNFGT